MKIYKCDCCKKHYDYACGSVSGSVINNVEWRGSYPKNWDLCPECEEKLHKVVKKWWDENSVRENA